MYLSKSVSGSEQYLPASLTAAVICCQDGQIPASECLKHKIAPTIQSQPTARLSLAKKNSQIRHILCVNQLKTYPPNFWLQAFVDPDFPRHHICLKILAHQSTVISRILLAAAQRVGRVLGALWQQSCKPGPSQVPEMETGISISAAPSPAVEAEPCRSRSRCQTTPLPSTFCDAGAPMRPRG